MCFWTKSSTQLCFSKEGCQDDHYNYCKCVCKCYVAKTNHITKELKTATLRWTAVNFSITLNNRISHEGFQRTLSNLLISQVWDEIRYKPLQPFPPRRSFRNIATFQNRKFTGSHLSRIKDSILFISHVDDEINNKQLTIFIWPRSNHSLRMSVTNWL